MIEQNTQTMQKEINTAFERFYGKMGESFSMLKEHADKNRGGIKVDFLYNFLLNVINSKTILRQLNNVYPSINDDEQYEYIYSCIKNSSRLMQNVIDNDIKYIIEYEEKINLSDSRKIAINILHIYDNLRVEILSCLFDDNFFVKINELETLNESMNEDYDIKINNLERKNEDVRNAKGYIESIIDEYGIRLVSMASAKHFEEETIFCNSSAIGWLCMSIFMFVATGFTAYNLFYYRYEEILQNIEWIDFIYPFMSKMLIMGILISGMVFCAKMYSRARHNYVLNTHRKNSLSTAALLVEYGKDNQDIVNLIISEATRTAFSPIETGYIKSDGDAPLDEVLRIVNALKGVTPSRGS